MCGLYYGVLENEVIAKSKRQFNYTINTINVHILHTVFIQTTVEPLFVDQSVKNSENLLFSAKLYYIILLANTIKFRRFCWILSFPRNVLYVLC